MERRFLRVINPANSGMKSAPRGLMKWIITVFIWLFVCGWFEFQAIEFDREKSGYTRELEKLKNQNRLLEYRVQALQENGRFRDAAKSRYGFIEPDRNHVILVKKQSGFFGSLFN
ncbi:MAG: hypothetical protein LLG37_08185 [Spirochaetia bacterium]|nr:hypothetical protein [Spirochaetia bacterium]